MDFVLAKDCRCTYDLYQFVLLRFTNQHCISYWCILMWFLSSPCQH